MTNPYTRSSYTAFPNGPGQGTDNVTSLASGAASALGVIGPASPLPAADYLIGPSTVMTGTGPSTTGTLSLYVIVSEDGSHYTGGMSATATTNATALNAWLANASLNAITLRGVVQTILANAANTAYYFDEFNLSQLFTNIPSYWALLLVNNSGAALNATATNHVFGYRADTYS